MRSVVGQWDIVEILNRIYEKYTRAINKQAFLDVDETEKSVLHDSCVGYQIGLADAWKELADFLRPDEDNPEPVFLEKDYVIPLYG